MAEDRFWCDGESAWFSVSELGADRNGTPIHTRGECHYPSGILCTEVHPGLAVEELVLDIGEMNLDSAQLYDMLPEQNKAS